MLSPSPQRRPLHTRRIIFQGFERDDGLWDMEGELHDSKHDDYESSEGVRKAGEPVHHMFLRVTLGDDLRIHAIESRMQNTPFGECSSADASLQRMVGQTMGAGWRACIERHVGGVQGCTHLRELLFNMATAAFQTIPHAMAMRRRAAGLREHEGAEPPFYMGRCQTWDFNGPVVRRVAPQFVGWVKKANPRG